MADGKFCEYCKKVENVKEFYYSNNYEKYPDGKLNCCKKSITRNVDNWDIKTVLPIMEECDVPFIPDKWNSLLTKYGKDRRAVSGMTIFGRYLASMRIKPFTDYRWKDTEYLQSQAELKIKETMQRQGYGAAEIDTVIREGRVVAPEKPPELETSSADNYSTIATGGEDYFTEQYGTDDLGDDLTPEEKTSLRLKWGKVYKPEEWVRLEQLYREMEESYDIQGAGHEDILKLVCKTSLKANQLLDIGDVDGAQKMIKMYDGLMKSGKFTAAQNKTENGDCLDSISEIVSICEKEGFIPRFYIESPNDRVDETIFDMKEYTKSLVTEELNLGNLIESAIKQMAFEESKEEDLDDEDDEISLEDLDEIKHIELKDYEEFAKFEEKQEKEDDKLIMSLLEDDF